MYRNVMTEMSPDRKVLFHVTSQFQLVSTCVVIGTFDLLH